jgi:hypothetical protein
MVGAEDRSCSSSASPSPARSSDGEVRLPLEESSREENEVAEGVVAAEEEGECIYVFMYLCMYVSMYVIGKQTEG